MGFLILAGEAFFLHVKLFFGVKLFLWEPRNLCLSCHFTTDYGPNLGISFKSPNGTVYGLQKNVYVEFGNSWMLNSISLSLNFFVLHIEDSSFKNSGITISRAKKFWIRRSEFSMTLSKSDDIFKKFDAINLKSSLTGCLNVLLKHLGFIICFWFLAILQWTFEKNSRFNLMKFFKNNIPRSKSREQLWKIQDSQIVSVVIMVVLFQWRNLKQLSCLFQAEQ